jgi:hypothetical protein
VKQLRRWEATGGCDHLTLKYKIFGADICFLDCHLYASVRYRGDHMKKSLLAAASFAVLVFSNSANAADLAERFYTPPPPPPVWTWSGIYVGGEGGYGWGTQVTGTVWPRWSAPTKRPSNSTTSLIMMW